MMRILAVCTLSVIGFTIPHLAMAQSEDDSLVRVGRYQLVDTSLPNEKRSPLSTVVSLSFPKNVTTVGDAAGYLLRRTGYALAPVTNEKRAAAHERLTAFNLPEVHRSFDDVTVLDILIALAGEGYQPVINHEIRQIQFALREESSGKKRGRAQRALYEGEL